MKQLHYIQYGDKILKYELHFSNKRKTLAIEVQSNLTVIVKAPAGTILEYINAIVKIRTPWILNKQRALMGLPQHPPKQYVSGEKHYFLGCQYRLNVITGKPTGVTLRGDSIWLTVTNFQDTAGIKKQLDNWYRHHAKQVFAERLILCHRQLRDLGIERPVLQMRKMKKRWGSCTSKGKILLNTSLIKAPIACIDYVLTHELCHLKIFNHSEAFYKLLTGVMPDWKIRKIRLNSLDILDE